MRPLTIVTTSWDDGDPRDLRLADLLLSRGIRGTFYVPATAYQGRTLLNRTELRSLAGAGFEIGAHSVSHRNLSTLGPMDLVHEVRDCKHILEATLGQEVFTFCYPNGRYNAAVIRQVRDAGYKCARNTRMLSMKTLFDPYEMPTTVQSYPHGAAAYFKNSLRAGNVAGLATSLVNFRLLRNWLDLATALFHQVLKNGGVWHLYGHSWEIEHLNLWAELGALLDHICRRKDVIYATNTEVLYLCVGVQQSGMILKSVGIA